MIPLSDGMRAREFPDRERRADRRELRGLALYELPHLNSSIFHASFYACTVTTRVTDLSHGV